MLSICTAKMLQAPCLSLRVKWQIQKGLGKVLSQSDSKTYHGKILKSSQILVNSVNCFFKIVMLSLGFTLRASVSVTTGAMIGAAIWKESLQQ